MLAYAIQSIIADRGRPQPAAGARTAAPEAPLPAAAMGGGKCPECGAHAVIPKDGCSFCTACGYVGACG